MRREPIFLLRLWVLVVVLLLARLSSLQLEKGRDLAQVARASTTRELAIPPARGRIFDRVDRVLVDNQADFVLSYRPHRDELETLATELSKRFSKELGVIATELKEQRFRPGLDAESLAWVGTLKKRFPGLNIEVRGKRLYPHERTAAHLLGHVGLKSADDPYYLQGRDGLELSQDEVLKGVAGSRTLVIDAVGRPLKLLNEKTPQAGLDLRLSLDLELQRKAEKYLAEGILARGQSKAKAKECSGALVALDCRTGAVRAMVSYPDYDPRWFSEGASQKQFSRLFNDPRAPLLNRAVSSAFPPASTFKMVTSMAAMKKNLITPQSYYYCPGYHMVGDLRFNCFVRSGHGSLSYEQALAHSCDTVFYQLGVALGAGSLVETAESLGLNRVTGLELPGESAGQVPGPEWKEKNLGQSWFAGDDANAAIGQGFVTATPLQMACVVAALATGEYRPPFLVEARGRPGAWEELPRKPSRPLELPSGHERILKGMVGAVDYGTSTAAYSTVVSIAGKTGTVENSKTTDNPRGLNHTWFVSYSPRENPTLVVVVFLEKSGGYGGGTAAPVARRVHEAWARENPVE